MRTSLTTIAERICEQSKVNRDRRVASASDYVINRCLLMEIHLRFAFHIFNCDVVREEEETAETRLSQTQAIYLYVETIMKPFWASVKMTWHHFRERQLWTSENARMFTICEPSLQALYSKYCSICPSAEVPGVMTMASCHMLFSLETLPKLRVTAQMV